MNVRDSAVRHALQGMRVFRIKYGSKKIHIDGDWATSATADPLKVWDMWTGEDGAPLNHNIGVLATDFVYLDVDKPKAKGAKVSADGFASLPKLGPLPKTYTVKSPSGGVHFYFDAQGSAFGQRDIEPGINVRATNGYVLGAGSTFVASEPGDVSGTYILVDDAPIAPLPSALADKLRQVRERQGHETEAATPLDLPGALAAARGWLEHSSPEAGAGERNNVGYRVSAQLHGFGLSVATVRGLLSEWNDAKVSPPLDDDEIEHLSRSGANYRQNQRGIENPVFGFDEIADPEPAAEQQEAASRFGSMIRRYSATEATDAAIPRRPWLVEGVAIRQAVTILGGYGSVGKSVLSLQLAAALATGAAGLGFAVKEPTPVLVVNNEDPDDELDRRLAAVVQHFGVDRAAAHERIHLYSGHGAKLKVARKQGKSGSIVDGEHFADLCHYVAAHKIGCVMFDPLVSIHECAENDNTEMQRVMERLTLMAARTGCSVIAIHHTNKPPTASSESYAGNVNSIRGASAIKDAARIALTMFGMSEKDAEKYRIPDKARGRFARLDDAKANLHLASPEARWFKKESVRIANGEELGVMVPHVLSARPVEKDGEAGAVLEILSKFTGDEIVMSQAIKAVQADPLFRDRTRDAVAKAVKMAVETSTLYSGEWTGATGGLISVRPQEQVS